MANFQLNVKINGVEQSVSTIGQLEDALNATKEELKDLEIGSDSFKELTNQARNLQGELERTFEKATNFNGSLDEITASVGRLGSTVAAGFALTTSAIGLLGDESEELTQAQIRAQQALAIAFSATTIATNAARFASDAKLIVDKLQLGVTNLMTAAIGKETISKSANAVATGTATIAQRALNAAMAANPILLVASALAILTGALFLFSSDTDEAANSVENLKKAKQDYIKEIDNTTTAINREINKQKELVKLQSQILLVDAKTAEERIKIQTETNLKLGELDEQSLTREKEALDEKLRINKESLKAIPLLELQTEEGKAEAEELTKTIDGIVNNIEDVNNALEIAAQLRNNTNILSDVDLLKAQRENLDKRREAINSYNDDVKKLTQKRADDVKDIERGLIDFQIERISEVTEEFTLNLDGELVTFTTVNEDIIKGYDERIEKIRETSRRQEQDANSAFESEIESFRKAQRAKVDADGIRVISDKKIEEDILKQRELFNEQQQRQSQISADQIIQIEQDKANKIKEIDSILQNELAFGDNNLADNRNSLALEAIEFEIEQSKKRIEIQRGINTQEIRLRQELENKKLDLIRKSQLEQLRIEFEESIKSVQGTEEQKGIQRERLTKQYNERVKRINDDFRNSEAAAEKANADEILAYKIQKLQEFSQLAGQFLNQGLALSTAISDINRVQMENDLNNLKEGLSRQSDIYNENYQTELNALNNKFESGKISQEEYNQSIESLNENLNNSIQKLQDKQSKAEFESKKKAFEQDKKLRIAQAIIAGAQGAVSAFAGAMSLGPIAGPIVGGVLSGLVAATTTAQVSAIRKTKFGGGAGDISTNTTSSSSVSGVGGQSDINSSSGVGGGFTGFNDNINTSSGNSNTSSSSSQSGQSMQRVYVVEYDITSTQQRVQVLESGASFG